MSLRSSLSLISRFRLRSVARRFDRYSEVLVRVATSRALMGHSALGTCCLSRYGFALATPIDRAPPGRAVFGMHRSGGAQRIAVAMAGHSIFACVLCPW